MIMKLIMIKRIFISDLDREPSNREDEMRHKTFILLLLPTSSQRASSHQELLGFVRGSRYIAFVFASSGCSISGSHVSGFVAPLQPDVHRRVDSKKMINKSSASA